MLDQLLTTFRLSAEIYNNAQFCGHWHIKEHSEGLTCFHMVTVGQCIMSVPNHGDYKLNMGDLVIFPHEMPHTLKPCPNSTELSRNLNRFSPNEDKEGTALLCGTLAFEHQGFHHILNALPSVMIIEKHHAPWLPALVEQIRYEVLKENGGDRYILNRISELLFVYGFRHYMQHQTNRGFLRVFMDTAFQNALQAMQQQPEKNWSLESLASLCHMSRTSFSVKFKQVSSMTVNEFFTWWRMQLAYDQLQQGKRITQVAPKVGYQSESSFSRAFKKCFGMSPSQIPLRK